MRYKQSVSALACMAAGALSTFPAFGQVANTTAANVNVLTLISPFLKLNSTATGTATLSANLRQAIAINTSATLTQQQLAISDKSILNAASNNLSSVGIGTYGVAANLAGGLPAQTPINGITPQQPVGGLGSRLGPIYQTGVAGGTGGPLGATVTLLTSAYNFTSSDLGVAKFYFANGTINGTNAAVAPAGLTLPTFNGLPNTTNSVYDLAYGVTNQQANQDIYGSSRPVQVASGSFNKFDPTALNGISTNPSFPSGHTNYAFTDSILLAMLVPQEYQSMLSRGAEYADSRIVLGVHYPLDIIASRAFASYDLAQAFTNPAYINNAGTTGTAINLPSLFAAAAPQIQTYLATQCGASVAACATSAANVANDPYAPSAANQTLYTSRLTYGLPTLTFAQAPREAAPTGGPDASILLASIYGGSTSAAKQIAPNGGLYGTLQTSTINQILVNTEATALTAFYGTSLSYWTRIDLYSASGYFQNVTGTLSLDPKDIVTANVKIASGGVLSADGTITGTTTVGSGGKLAGSGTVASTTVGAGGTLAPGSLAAQSALAGGGKNVSGTRLSVAGTLSFAPGSTFAVFATPSQATNVAATGTANVSGAKVTVKTSGGPFSLAKNYTILTANGGIGGTFKSATTRGSLPFLTPSLSYGAERVTLSFDPNANALSAAAATTNQAAIIGALAGAGSTSRTNPLLNAALNLQSAAQLRGALEPLSGEGITASQNIAQRSAQAFGSAITDQTTFYGGDAATNSITLSAPTPGFVALAPDAQGSIHELADLPSATRQPLMPAVPTRTWRAWASGFGGAEYIRGSAATGAAAQDNTIYGGALGVDYQLTPNYLVGIALGGSDGSFSVAGASTSGSTTGGHVAFYDLATFGAFYGASSTSFSYYTNKSTRTVPGFGGLSGETERGTFDSHEFRGRLEFGRHFDDIAGFRGTVTPFAALELADLRSNGFAETATSGPGLFALSVSGQSTASVPAYLGARFRSVADLGNGMILSPTLQLAYVHEFAPYRSQFAGIADLPGSTFLVDGARPARDSAQIKAGGELVIGAHSVIFANFDGEFSGVNQLYAGKGGFRYTW